MAIEGTCVFCGWLVVAQGTFEPRAKVRPKGAKKTRCTDSACVVGSFRRCDGCDKPITGRIRMVDGKGYHEKPCPVVRANGG